MPKKKKQEAQKVFDSQKDCFVDAETGEPIDEKEEVVDEEEQELSPKQKIAKLKKQLAEAEVEENKKHFLQTAPARINELEKLVSENRDYLIKLNKKLQTLQDNFATLISQKK